MGRSIFPPPGSIKSIQRGAHNTNVTVAAVNTSKSILLVNGAASSSNNPQNASLRLTGSTTLTYDQGSLSGAPVLAWQLVEYY